MNALIIRPRFRSIPAGFVLRSGILAVVPITFWYVILGISTAALVAAGIAALMRIRRLSQASQTQYRRAVHDEDQPEVSAGAVPDDEKAAS